MVYFADFVLKLPAFSPLPFKCNIYELIVILSQILVTLQNFTSFSDLGHFKSD